MKIKIVEPYQEGYAAGLGNGSTCPHDGRTKEGREWWRGFIEGDAKRCAGITVKNQSTIHPNISRKGDRKMRISELDEVERNLLTIKPNSPTGDPTDISQKERDIIHIALRSLLDSHDLSDIREQLEYLCDEIADDLEEKGKVNSSSAWRRAAEALGRISDDLFAVPSVERADNNREWKWKEKV